MRSRWHALLRRRRHVRCVPRREARWHQPLLVRRDEGVGHADRGKPCARDPWKERRERDSSRRGGRRPWLRSDADRHERRLIFEHRVQGRLEDDRWKPPQPCSSNRVRNHPQCDLVEPGCGDLRGQELPERFSRSLGLVDGLSNGRQRLLPQGIRRTLKEAVGHVATCESLGS